MTCHRGCPVHTRRARRRYRRFMADVAAQAHIAWAAALVKRHPEVQLFKN